MQQVLSLVRTLSDSTMNNYLLLQEGRPAAPTCQSHIFQLPHLLCDIGGLGVRRRCGLGHKSPLGTLCTQESGASQKHDPWHSWQGCRRMSAGKGMTLVASFPSKTLRQPEICLACLPLCPQHQVHQLWQGCKHCRRSNLAPSGSLMSDLACFAWLIQSVRLLWPYSSLCRKDSTARPASARCATWVTVVCRLWGMT